MSAHERELYSLFPIRDKDYVKLQISCITPKLG